MISPPLALGLDRVTRARLFDPRPAWHDAFVVGVVLAVAAVMRDVGIKDFGQLFRGHGGLLDRFDSLMLVLPAIFHYVKYVRGIGDDQIERIFSHAWF